jgi:hypothetical protein
MSERLHPEAQTIHDRASDSARRDAEIARASQAKLELARRLLERTADMLRY